MNLRFGSTPPVRILLLFICLTALHSCAPKPQSPVIARVGHQILTLDDLYKSIPPEYSNFITREQMVNYIKRWIDTELLYQEALRQNIHSEKEMRQRLEKMKKDLLSAEVINRNAIPMRSIQISEEEIKSHYDAHRDSYIRDTDAVRYLDIIINESAQAWKVHGMLNAKNFLSLAQQYSKVPPADPVLTPFVSVATLPQQIRETIAQIRVDGISPPIQLNDGFHILKIIDKQKSGTVCDIEEVRDEIINSLSTEAHSREIENLLSRLRLKMEFEFHFDRIPVQRPESGSHSQSFPSSYDHNSSTHGESN